jgi:hypothetical protein
LEIVENCWKLLKIAEKLLEIAKEYWKIVMRLLENS